MKVLMIHNTVTNYRVPFFSELAKIVDLTLVLFQMNENMKIYNDKERYSEINGAQIITTLDYEKIDSIILREKFDVIILPGIDDIVSLKVFLHFARFKDDSLKVVFWGMWEPENIDTSNRIKVKRKLQRTVRKWALQFSDGALSYGKKATDYLRYIGYSKPIYPFINSTFVKNSNKELDIRGELGFSSDDKLVLYLGRIVERKGVKKLIDSFSLISDQKIKLLIVGGGEDLKSMEKYVIDKKVQQRIIFVGAIPPEERSNYYEQSDLFVIPSFFLNGFPEPWGLTVNEALQFKIPVVATTAVGAAYDLINKNNGIIVKENDHVELAEGIITAIEIKKSNIPSIRFTPETMAINVYNGLIKVAKKEEI